MKELEAFADNYAAVWSLAQCIKARIPRMLVQERKQAAKRVHKWAAEILQGGASRAHLWTKPTEGWKPEVVGCLPHEAGTMAATTDEKEKDAPTKYTADPIKILDGQRNIWKDAWRATDVQHVEADDELWAIMGRLVQVQEEQINNV